MIAPQRTAGWSVAALACRESARLRFEVSLWIALWWMLAILVWKDLVLRLQPVLAEFPLLNLVRNAG